MNTLSPLTSLSLKLIGIIFIISALLDYIIFAWPDPSVDWLNPNWQISFVTQIVDRGIVPLVGIALILIGYWIDWNTESTTQKRSGLDLRLPVFILASLLGIVFLLLVPLHLGNLNRAKTEALEQIQQGAGQGEDQIKASLTQINQISQNPQQLDQAVAQLNQVIEGGQFQGRPLTQQQTQALRQQRDNLRSIRDLAKNNPKRLKERIAQRKNELETELRNRRTQAEEQAKAGAFKQGMRVGLSSLMLAIGYCTIGWLGLRGLGDTRPNRPRDAKR